MEELELRQKIYKRLGLEFGSLKSESGNDWVRAEKEIQEEIKEEQNKLEKEKEKEINFLTIEKTNENFTKILNTVDNKLQNYKIELSNRTDLNDEEKLILINNGSKEVLTNIAKNDNLSIEIVKELLNKKNSTYSVLKELSLNKNIDNESKELIIENIKNRNNTKLYGTMLDNLINKNENVEVLNEKIDLTEKTKVIKKESFYL